MTDMILRLPEVIKRLGIKKTTIYKLTKAGELKSVPISARCVGWPASNVNAYIEKIKSTDETGNYNN